MSVDYAKMYAIVCAAASDAIDLLDREQHAQARECLQKALEQAEELYLNAGTGDIVPLHPKNQP